ncbi:MAG TPA: carboxymuconolactone decarboxylase family protein [Luteitalea sp.]|nr:carboxymuconolactone decarboxylase family protein [Luteitalea sp.]
MTSDAAKALVALHQAIEASGLDHSLGELVKIRASQINGCAYCIDMHTTDARALGETEQRIYALSAWRETPFFTPRERAALAWTESVTLLSQTHVPDEVYDEVRAQFEEKDLVSLTWAVVAINAWNRLAISFRNVPGTYKRARA